MCLHVKVILPAVGRARRLYGWKLGPGGCCPPRVPPSERHTLCPLLPAWKLGVLRRREGGGSRKKVVRGRGRAGDEGLRTICNWRWGALGVGAAYADSGQCGRAEGQTPPWELACALGSLGSPACKGTSFRLKSPYSSLPIPPPPPGALRTQHCPWIPFLPLSVDKTQQ